MAISISTLALSKKYTEETAKAMGALKGAPCIISSIVPTERGNLITFKWTDTDGTSTTQTIEVLNGKDGRDGIDSSTMLEFHNRFEFPSIGDINKLYIAKDENKIYRYDNVKISYIPLITGDEDLSNLNIIQGIL